MCVIVCDTNPVVAAVAACVPEDSSVMTDHNNVPERITGSTQQNVNEPAAKLNTLNTVKYVEYNIAGLFSPLARLRLHHSGHLCLHSSPWKTFLKCE